MKRKGEVKHIELLDEDGSRFIPVSSKNKLKRLYQFLVVVVIIFIFSLFSFTYSEFVSTSHGNPKINVATWKFEINSGSTKLDIDLADTIIPNKFSDTIVIPGTKGKISLEIDFSSTKVATQYNISVDLASTFAPKNLKFYTDEAMTKEFSGFQGKVMLEDINKTIKKSIYWQWDYTLEDETIDWSNKEISLGLVATASQIVS